MSFDIDAYKRSRMADEQNEARENLAKSVAMLHMKLDQILELLKPAEKEAKKHKE